MLWDRLTYRYGINVKEEGISLLLPSIFPSIRVFSNESVLCIRWPKYWSFRFSISPCNEYSGPISFRMDGFDLLGIPGDPVKMQLVILQVQRMA